MNDKQFKDMDEKMMDRMKELREQKVSDGILKGFSASVERRLSARKQAPQAGMSGARAFGPVWVPVFAVLILASYLVLKTPLVSNTYLPAMTPGVELAQAPQTAVTDEELQEEIELLNELGVWDEMEEVGGMESEEAILEAMELTRTPAADSTLV